MLGDGLPYDLDVLDWSALVVAALILGLAKTLLSGLGPIAVAIFALVIPARESTGALLPLLLAGDALAIVAYRRHGDLRRVLRLLLGVLPGFVVGAAFLAVVGDQVLRYAMGALLLAIGFTQLEAGRHAIAATATDDAKPGAAAAAGASAGFTTMIANAGGPFMTWYLLRAGLEVTQVAANAAFFFAAVNVVKVPISIGLGLLTMDGVVLSSVLVAPLTLGSLAGLLLARRIDRGRFATAAALIAATAGAALLW